MSNNKDTNLVWIDLEMTGLGADKHKIVQIACIITDQDLNIISQSDEILIKQDKSAFDTTNQMVVESFINTGFADKVANATDTEQTAERKILDFIKQHVNPNTSPLCGNSVYNDRMFIIKYMPDLDTYLHYRLIDVSTLRELAKRWYQKHVYTRKKTHRALDDIIESISELKHYKNTLFKTNS